MKEDKIFNNRFNTGEIDFEIFGAISIRPDSEDADIFELIEEPFPPLYTV